MLDVYLLGSGGHKLLPSRHLTSLYMKSFGSALLIDCGEATDIAIYKNDLPINQIDVICITHMHADHTIGLSGILAEMQDLNRKRPLVVIGPVGTKQLVEYSLKIARSIKFKVEVEEVKETAKSFVYYPFKVECLKVDHSCICYAYKVTLMHKRKCLPEKAMENGVPVEIWDELLKYGSAIYEGKKWSVNLIAGAPRKGISISYCTDSRPTVKLPEFIYESDLFVCEGMYAEENAANAKKYKHMTFREAAILAKEGCVKELWLTHFTPSMVFPHRYLQQALNEFRNSQTGYDGMNKVLLFEE